MIRTLQVHEIGLLQDIPAELTRIKHLNNKLVIVNRNLKFSLLCVGIVGTVYVIHRFLKKKKENED